MENDSESECLQSALELASSVQDLTGFNYSTLLSDKNAMKEYPVTLKRAVAAYNILHQLSLPGKQERTLENRRFEQQRIMVGRNGGLPTPLADPDESEKMLQQTRLRRLSLFVGAYMQIDHELQSLVSSLKCMQRSSMRVILPEGERLILLTALWLLDGNMLVRSLLSAPATATTILDSICFLMSAAEEGKIGDQYFGDALIVLKSLFCSNPKKSLLRVLVAQSSCISACSTRLISCASQGRWPEAFDVLIAWQLLLQKKQLRVVKFATLVKQLMTPAITTVERVPQSRPMSNDEEGARQLMSMISLQLAAAGVVTTALSWTKNSNTTVNSVSMREELKRNTLLAAAQQNAQADDIRNATFCPGGCGQAETTATSFKKCSRCKLIRYCSVQCQRRHWKAGHKLECKKEQK